ncbi:hypothetical protein EYR17_001175 [Escherichia coli]|nr:hypothetical protein [Escherichia coli]
MSGDRIGLAGLSLRYVALRDVLRGDYVGITWGVSSIFFSAAGGFFVAGDVL